MPEVSDSSLDLSVLCVPLKCGSNSSGPALACCWCTIQLQSEIAQLTWEPFVPLCITDSVAVVASRQPCAAAFVLLSFRCGQNNGRCVRKRLLQHAVGA